jgi:ribosomal protein S18 acetylase RimI-like enzyme
VTPAITRRPYEPRRLETLTTFATWHPISRQNAPPVRRILETWSGAVFEVLAGGRTALVAAVVDRMENVHDAALLEVLGWDDSVPLATLLGSVVGDAVEVARAAGRPVLSLSLPAGFVSEVGDGWSAVEGSFVMERGVEQWSTPPLPEGTAWEDLTVAGLPEHYAALKAAFVADPGTMIPPFPTFADVAMASDPPVRVLRSRGVEVGFARVTLEPARLGYVASVGRVPAEKGRGWGPIVLAEAMRVLVDRGCTRMRLGVTASNVAAVRLYQRTGFQVVESWVTWHRAVENA